MEKNYFFKEKGQLLHFPRAQFLIKGQEHDITYSWFDQHLFSCRHKHSGSSQHQSIWQSTRDKFGTGQSNCKFFSHSIIGAF